MELDVDVLLQLTKIEDNQNRLYALISSFLVIRIIGFWLNYFNTAKNIIVEKELREIKKLLEKKEKE